MTDTVEFGKENEAEITKLFNELALLPEGTRTIAYLKLLIVRIIKIENILKEIKNAGKNI